MDVSKKEFVESMIARSKIAAANVLVMSKAYELLAAELQRLVDADELSDEFMNNAFHCISQFAVALTERPEADLSPEMLRQGWGADVAALHVAVRRLHSEGAPFDTELVELAFGEVKNSH